MTENFWKLLENGVQEFVVESRRKKSVIISDLFIRATAGVDRICSFWRPAGQPEKEPWT